MKILKGLLAGLGVVVALGAGSAVRAQQAGEAPPPATVPPATVPPAGVAALAAVSGPTVYVADGSGRLGTVNLGTGAVSVKGTMKSGSQTKVMTDIAFCPDGTLYGITFQADHRLYRINPNASPPSATVIGSHGRNDLNALVCNASGQLFAAGFGASRLYKLNKTNAQLTLVGNTGSVKSDGDLAFHEGGLFLTTTGDDLAKLNKTTGAVLSQKAYSVTDMWGLFSTGTDKLYGVAGTKLYKFTENGSGPTGATTLVVNFTGKGLNKINGAAYNGNFQN